MSTPLDAYCFAWDGMFVVPIEGLTSAGMTPAFRATLLEQGAAGEAWAEQFDQAFATYWERASALSAAAPHHWYPPRLQHVCIVTEPDRVRPYFQPFNKSSWLLYASDFEPATTTPEFAAFQFFHVERMGILQQIVPSLIANLAYFLTLSDEEVEQFCDGCRRTTRPDLAGYQALVDAMPAVRQLHHETLRPAALAIPGAVRIPDLGLVFPASLQEPLAALQSSWGRAAQNVFERHRGAHVAPSRTRGTRVGDWLVEARPPLLVTGAEGRILWDCEMPDERAALDEALAEASADAEVAIRSDLEAVGEQTARFLACARDPQELVDPSPHMTEEGLSYVHRERKLVAYSIGPGENENRIWQETPPYERWMLAARTAHEWGHLVAESGWVHVPDARKEERAEKEAALVALFDEVHDSAPDPVRAATAEEAAHYAAKSGSLGNALLKGMMIRIEDYQANLFAHRLLDADAMDTYVRNNVFCELPGATRGGVYFPMVQQVYELQYLRLSRIPEGRDWFLRSTWFAERFIEPGIITLEQFHQLADAIAAVCDCYELDPERFDFTALDAERERA